MADDKESERLMPGSTSSDETNFDGIREAAGGLPSNHYDDAQQQGLAHVGQLIVSNEARDARVYFRANPMVDEMAELFEEAVAAANAFNSTRNAVVDAGRRLDERPSNRRYDAFTQASEYHDLATNLWIAIGTQFSEEVHNALNMRDQDAQGLVQTWMSERQADQLAPDQQQRLYETYAAWAYERMNMPVDRVVGQTEAGEPIALFPTAQQLDGAFEDVQVQNNGVQPLLGDFAAQMLRNDAALRASQAQPSRNAGAGNGINGHRNNPNGQRRNGNGRGSRRR